MELKMMEWIAGLLGAVAGALLLILADTFGKWIIAPVILPIGALTALRASPRGTPVKREKRDVPGGAAAAAGAVELFKLRRQREGGAVG